MQPCNRIYYSKVFLKAQHVSSGTRPIIRSSKLYLQPLVYIPMSPPPLSLDNGQSPHGYINQRLQVQFRAPHVEPSINFGIINSITKLHLVGISTESSTMHESMNIKFTDEVLSKKTVILMYLWAEIVSFVHSSIFWLPVYEVCQITILPVA